MRTTCYKTLCLDIGGVLLTNGWDRHMRERASQNFNLDYLEMNSRHALTFDTYEIGKISLDEYLNRVVFYEPRQFTKEAFKEFMFAQSQSFPEMIQLIREIKSRFNLHIFAITNEGRELMMHRMERFRMKEYIDFFVCSSFVGLRKPDEEIYHLALDMIQVDPKEIIYIDDRAMLVEIGRKLGFQAIQHQNFEQTQTLLMDFLTSNSF